MAAEPVLIGARYRFTSFPGYGENGLDSTVGQYNEEIVTVLSEQVEGVDEENRPMWKVATESGTIITVFDEEIAFNRIG